MGSKRVELVPLIIISSLIVGSYRLPGNEISTNLQRTGQVSSYYCAKDSTSVIIAEVESLDNSPNLKNRENLYGDFTEEEIDLMAVICYREARGEGIEGMRLIADVILNRVDSEQFPNTVKEVISQPRQFATYRKNDMTEENLTIDCYGAVLAEIEERTDNEILYFTAGGYNTSGKPAYKNGNHYFSK